MAQSTRPQLASAPNMAALSREEPTTLRLSRSALLSFSEPWTVQVMSRLAPSPSAAIFRARSVQMYIKASFSAA